MVPKRPSMAKCDRQSECLGKRLDILSCLPSGTSLLPLATRRVLNMGLRALVLRRAWLSIPPPPAMPTTARIVTVVVTHSRHTARTRKCTSKVIKLKNIFLMLHGLTVQQRMQIRTTSNNECIKSIKLPLISFLKSALLTTFLTEDICIICHGSMGRFSISKLCFDLHFHLVAAVCFFAVFTVPEWTTMGMVLPEGGMSAPRKFPWWPPSQSTWEMRAAIKR